MKKAIITIISVFAVLFCLVSLILPRYKAEVYMLMYPQKVTVENSASIKNVKLKKGDFFVFGTCYGEDIIWEVVDCKERPLAWSRNAVCFRSYDDKSSEWKTSELRAWMNDTTENGFMSDTNFTPTEKALIFNDKNADSMFVLSKSQLQKFTLEKRAKAPTVSAVRNYGSDKLLIRRNCWYWTSSGIGTNSSSVTAVTQTGGFYKTLPTDSLMGVCPAFYLASNNVTICGGNGSAEKPYVIATGGESR